MATTVWAVLGVLVGVACLFYTYAVKTAAAGDLEAGTEIAETEIVDTHGVNVRCSDCGRTIQIALNSYQTSLDGTAVGRQRITLRNIVEEIAEHRVTDCAMADA